MVGNRWAKKLARSGVLAGHRRDVEHHGLAALRLHHAEVLAGHDVTRREFGARIDVLLLYLWPCSSSSTAPSRARLPETSEVLAHGQAVGWNW